MLRRPACWTFKGGREGVAGKEDDASARARQARSAARTYLRVARGRRRAERASVAGRGGRIQSARGCAGKHCHRMRMSVRPLALNTNMIRDGRPRHVRGCPSPPCTKTVCVRGGWHGFIKGNKGAVRLGPGKSIEKRARGQARVWRRASSVEPRSCRRQRSLGRRTAAGGGHVSGQGLAREFGF